MMQKCFTVSILILESSIHLSILLSFLDSCFLNNQMYSFSKFQQCTKVGTPEVCQLTCQQTDGCIKFSFFTKYFRTSNDAENGSRREAWDCCLAINTKSTSNTITKNQNVISGPKFCRIGKTKVETGPSKSKFNEMFTGKLLYQTKTKIGSKTVSLNT